MVHIHTKIHHHFFTKKQLYGKLMLGIFILLLLLAGTFMVTRGITPHISELAFIEQSRAGIGSVIPASCDSSPPTDHFAGDCFTTCSASPANPQVGQAVTWTVSPEQASYINPGLNYVTEIRSGPSSDYSANTNYGSLPYYTTSKAITYSSPGVEYTRFTTGGVGAVQMSVCSVNVSSPPPPSANIHFQ